MNDGHARYAITNGEALSKCPMEVNDSAGGDFISDAREDPVVAIPVNDAVVRNEMSEVPHFLSGPFRRELQCIPIRVEVIVRSRQIDD
jgi:hypothetical protein